MPPQDLIRISVGTEHIDDIIADFEQSFNTASAAKTSGGSGENATKTGTETDAPMVVQIPISFMKLRFYLTCFNFPRYIFTQKAMHKELIQIRASKWRMVWSPRSGGEKAIDYC